MTNRFFLIAITITYLFFSHQTSIFAINYGMDYTSSGFNPASLTTTTGDTLTIFNQSDRMLELYTAPSTSQIRVLAKEVAIIEPGSSFSFSFTTPRTHLFFNLQKTDAFSKVTVFEPPPTIEGNGKETQNSHGEEGSGLKALDEAPISSRSEYSTNSNTPITRFTRMITKNTQKLQVIIPYFRYIFYVTFTISLILTIGFIQHLFFLRSKKSNRKRNQPNP